MDIKFIVDLNNLERRIDNYLFSKIKYIPKSLIYKLIRNGCIKINNKKVNINYKLKINDNINIYGIILNNKIKNYNISKYFKSKEFFNNILYEDKYLLAINKPSGISVQGGTNIKYDIISSLKGIYGNNYNLIHRLDKDSSGILLISKNEFVLRNINKQFLENKIYKEYYALVNGKWNKKNKVVNLPILKIKISNNNFIYKVNKFGKKSVTIFKIKKIFNNLTLLKIIPKTGRTHQIRVHTSYFGKSIILDKIYGNSIINNKFLLLGYNKMFLHSYFINFFHPIYNKYINIKSKLRNDFNKIINNYNNL